MSIFTLKESKATNTLPEQCKNIIKKYLIDGKFDITKAFDNPQDYTTIYFLMSQNCNGKCSYCYQPKEFRQDINLSKKIIDDSMNFVLSNFQEDKIKFSLFGGEPLLNFDMVKYLVDRYSMLKFVVTTNGILIKENKEIANWIKSHVNNVNVSVSVNAQKYIYGKKDFLKYIKPCLDAVKENGGDVHYVVHDPDEPNVYKEIIYLFEYGIPQVRISPARHWDIVADEQKNKSFIELFKKIADYIYFSGQPKFYRTPWDTAFKNNIYNSYKQKDLRPLPPTFCGCGYLYLAINHKGEIYPCDFFANFPEFKIGDIYKGFNNTAMFFRKMKDWIEGLYDNCKDCFVCKDKDIRLCPRAMCLAENYIVTGNPLKPAPNHCWTNKIEYTLFDYIARKAIKTGIDKLYKKP